MVDRGVLTDQKVNTDLTIHSAIVTEYDLLHAARYPVAPVDARHGKSEPALVAEIDDGPARSEFPRLRERQLGWLGLMNVTGVGRYQLTG